MSNQKVVEALKVLEQKAVYLAKESFAPFVLYTKPDYHMMNFHRTICNTLDKFERGEIKKLMLFVPPQHGKSELTTRRLPAYLLGKNPNRKIVVASYSATMASRFNRDIQRVIDEGKYKQLFEDTKLNNTRFVYEETSYLRNTEIFEIVGHKGFVKTVGRGGSLTGTPVDIGIIDDPLKDRQEAKSLTIRKALWEWYTDVFETRLHNESQQLLIQTRWDEDDLAGRLLKRDNDWTVLLFPAIKTGDKNDYDKRKTGEALWPEKHSLERLQKVRNDNKYTFNSLYQQDPKPNEESLIYTNWRRGKFDDTLPYFFVADYGFKDDPTTLTKMAIDRKSKLIYLDEKVYKQHMDTAQIGTTFKSIAGTKPIIADNESRLNFELKRDYGCIIKDAFKAHKVEGILSLQSFTFVITESSHNIINEANNYEWLDSAKNIPMDGNDHVWDPVRYGYNFMNKGGKKSSGKVFLIN